VSKRSSGATNLTKHFGSFTAVKDVNIHIKYGEVYGLLGANGAGKTTTIKMPCGLLAPTPARCNSRGRLAACARRVRPPWRTIVVNEPVRSHVFVRTFLRVAADVLRFGSSSWRSHAQLAAENLFLRKQLALYLERQVKPRRADDALS